MNTNKNSYIFIYATVMVVLVAVLLAATSIMLKPAQDKNIMNEKRLNILTSVFGGDASKMLKIEKNVGASYAEYITEEYVVSKDGGILSIYDVKADKFVQGSAPRAFDIDLKAELKTAEPKLPIFVCQKDRNSKAYIIPLSGTGLWGPLWGYICLDQNFDTVLGAVFAHKGETPGLGAEIATPAFQKQFIGKTIFGDGGDFTSVIIIKSGAKFGTTTEPHEVDGISGGTITSKGTSDMIYDCLKLYEPFLKDNMSK